MIDLHKQISQFHDIYVRLTRDQQDEMRAKRAINLTRIRDGLEANNKPAYVEDIKQGGYKHKTMVQPPEAQPDLQYDIDNAIVFAKADAEVVPATARERVRAAIAKKGFGFKMQPVAKLKCVRVSYVDGKQCDFPVMRRTQNLLTGVYTYELAAGDDWVTRDSTEISEWVDERIRSLSPQSASSYQLRRIIRLMKYYGKTHAHANRHSFPSGIVMTALTIDHYVSKPDRDDWSFRETLRSIATGANTPVFAARELVSDEKDEERIPRLRDQAVKSVAALDELDTPSATKEEALKVWKRVFKHSFFAEENATKAEAAMSPAIATNEYTSDVRIQTFERHAEIRRKASGSIPPYGTDDD